MNERQRRFADEYIKTGNGYQSAIKAGYSESYANNRITELLGNVGIKEYINKQMQELHKSNIMDATEALYILSEIARGKRDEEVLILNPTTGKVERHIKKADNATVIKAITEILKRYPTAKLEIEKLKSQLIDTQMEDDTITIIDSWEGDDEDN